MENKNLIPFTPIGKGFLVEYVEKEKTDSGLIVPEGTSPELTDKDFKGLLVLSVGPLCTEVKPGDTVRMKDIKQRVVGHYVNVDGIEVTLLLFNEYDVMFIREDVPKVTEYKWLSKKPAKSTPITSGILTAN